MTDVLVTDGRIVGGRRRRPRRRAPTRGVIDCTGLLVTPGLIDLHVHVYPGLGDFCLHPDRVGVRQGVPTVIDGGTSGVATFGLARKWIDDPDVRTRILAFMDPCQIYFATKDFICHKLEIANDERNLDEASTAAMLAANDDVVIGMKVRACSTTDPEVSPFLDAAQRVAGEKPVMVHLGRFPHTPTIPTASSATHAAFRRRDHPRVPGRVGRARRVGRGDRRVQGRGRPRRAPRHRALGHRLPVRDRAPAVRPGVPADDDLHRPQRVQRRRAGGVAGGDDVEGVGARRAAHRRRRDGDDGAGDA